jgi:hypothetical protein
LCGGVKRFKVESKRLSYSSCCDFQFFLVRCLFVAVRVPERPSVDDSTSPGRRETSTTDRLNEGREGHEIGHPRFELVGW